MESRQKQRWVLLFLLIILVFIGTFVYLLPYLFRLPFIHEKTEAFVSRQVKGDFTFQEGTLTFFPRPCIRIRNVELKTGYGISATIDMVSAYPGLLSLFRGKLTVARVTVIRPNCIAEIPEKEASSPSAIIFKNLQDRLNAFMTTLVPAAWSKFLIDIQYGTFTLIRAGKELFSMQEIYSRVQWKLPVVSIDITGKSDIWNEGTLAFSINTANRESEGRLALKKFTPGAVADLIFPKSLLRLDSAVLDTNIVWKTGDFDTWDLSFEVLGPDITFRKGNTIQIVRGEKAAGELKTNKTSTHMSITDLDLASPRMQLAGSLDLETEKPRADWQASARDVDLASAKAAVLFFVGSSKVARKIFTILPEGDIPQISLGQKARTPDGFRDVSSLYIRGRLNQAVVHVPKPDLLLTDTSGEVTVLNGILEADDVQTRLGNSTGSKGRFTMSLKAHKPTPFHVEADVHADVATLPPLLAGLFGDRFFSDEMRLITSAEGSAVGKLILDRGAGPLHVTVDVSDFDLSATYDRIPFPLTATGRGFHFGGGTVTVQDIQGKIGDSRFTDLTGEISLHASPLLTISAARADVNVDEMNSWLETDPEVSRIMKSLRATKGRISIDSFRFEGPLNTPGEWQFESEGHVTDTLGLLLPPFPTALFFHQGRFTMTRDKIDFSSDDLSVIDARIRAGGTLYNYLTKNRLLDAQIEGKLGQRACEWIYRQAPIPEMFRWRAPISLSPLTLRWRENDGLSLSGEAAAENGPLVTFDINHPPDTFVIKNLTIQDKETRAVITLTLDKTLLEIGFSGNLNGSSLNALLLENDVLAGSVRGNFSARYFFAAPLTSTLTGRLQLTGLDTNTFGLPLKIAEVSLTADGASSEISAARFSWKEIDLFASGRIAQIESGLLLDLDLDSERLNWSELKPLLEGNQTTGHPRPSFLFGNVRATCGKFTLSPAMAFQPLEAEFQLNGDRTDILFHRADACGISFPGTITVTPEKILFSFEPTATGQALEPTLACFQNGQKFMDGLFDLNGKLAFQLDGASIMESLEGEASLTAENGRIYRAVLLGKIFSLLNIGDMLSGDFPDLEKEGFAYKTSIFKGRFKHGRFELETGVIDSSGMKIFYEGDEDLINKRHDLTVVVAPLRTVDSVLEKIPLINSVFNKGAVIYPVKVTGSWDKPELTLLSPTAVGSEVWGIMVRTLRLPVTLLESLFPGKEKE